MRAHGCAPVAPVRAAHTQVGACTRIGACARTHVPANASWKGGRGGERATPSGERASAKMALGFCSQVVPLRQRLLPPPRRHPHLRICVCVSLCVYLTRWLPSVFACLRLFLCVCARVSVCVCVSSVAALAQDLQHVALKLNNFGSASLYSAHEIVSSQSGRQTMIH